MNFEYVLEMGGKKSAKKGAMELRDVLKELNGKIGVK